MIETAYRGDEFTLTWVSADYLQQENAARRLLWNGAKFASEAEMISRGRPLLLKALGVSQEESRLDIQKKVCIGVLNTLISEQDRKVLGRYLTCIELTGIIEDAIRDHVVYEHRGILKDFSLRGMSSLSVCERYGISERTLKRIRKEGTEAVDKVIRGLFGKLKEESPDLAREWGMLDAV